MKYLSAGFITKVARSFIACTVCFATAYASALCLDPKTAISGYHVPLNEEVQSTKYIVTGTITMDKAWRESSSSPDDIDAYIFTVQVNRNLKGLLPKSIFVRVENNSSRYPMEVGEKHLLFLSRQGKYFFVNSCGNSLVLPEGERRLKQVESMLGKPAA